MAPWGFERCSPLYARRHDQFNLHCSRFAALLAGNEDTAFHSFPFPSAAKELPKRCLFPYKTAAFLLFYL